MKGKQQYMMGMPIPKRSIPAAPPLGRRDPAKAAAARYTCISCGQRNVVKGVKCPCGG